MQKENGTVQLLTFKLDDQEYALKSANVVQVTRMVAMVRPPKSSEFIEGVFNLRDKVIPVINIRKLWAACQNVRCEYPSVDRTIGWSHNGVGCGWSCPKC